MGMLRPLPDLTWSPLYRPAKGHGVYSDSSFSGDCWLYRYMKAVDLYSTLESNSFYMSNVANWTDPYEKAWCEQLFWPGGDMADAQSFGSCWTRQNRAEPFGVCTGRCNHVDATANPCRQ